MQTSAGVRHRKSNVIHGKLSQLHDVFRLRFHHKKAVFFRLPLRAPVKLPWAASLTCV